jgi:DNA-binding response OmpR family regulator
MRILIIEEDVPLANFLAHSLGAEQYQVSVCRRQEGQVSSTDSDLVVLDSSVSAEQGVLAVQAMRGHAPAILIVVLTMRHGSEDLVRFLDAGADDYLTKPFSYAELSARIRALRRRSRLAADAVLKIGDLQLDRVQRQVERAGRSIELTTKEYSLLEYLMRNAGRRVTRAAILEHVWKALPSPGATNVVDVYIAYLNDEKLQLAQQENTVAGADIAAVASQLVNSENARNAALAATGKMSQGSLFDYL